MPTNHRSFSRLILSLSILLFAAGCQSSEKIPSISLISDPNPKLPPASHGSQKILAALYDRKTIPEHVTSLDAATTPVLIVAGVIGSNGPAETLLKSTGTAPPTGPESLVIKKIIYNDKPTWLLAGSDARGLMYAELDVADRIGWGKDPDFPLSELEDAAEKPDVSTRAVSIYTMNRAYWESRFYDEAYWTKYLDNLAQDRFNSFVVIFGYENGGFLAPCYPYFFNTDGFDSIRMIGITPDQQRRNITAFNRLIQMCHDRGIKFTVGIWDHIYRGGVQAGGVPGAADAVLKPTPGLVWGVTGDNLIPYTKASLTQFLHTFPGIDGIQFRMHDESGLRVSEQGPFWAEIFPLVKQQAPNVRLDLRAKGLPDSVIQNALDTGLNFRIETKTWMEQMGLPFHPTHVNPQDQENRRHGYADLLRYPQQYNIHWRMFNGGTTRILLWGDPEYARRFAESTHLYNGDGFEVNEPLLTKMEGQPHDAKPFDLLNPQYRYYDYEFERYWHFFQVFGRIGYDPRTPPQVWDHEFEKRFGSLAGADIESALHTASWILPRIIASSYRYSDFPMTVGWAEKQHGGTLASFSKAQGSDTEQFENFDEEAQRLLENGETTKVRPQETSLWFAQTSAAVAYRIADAEKQIGEHRNKEFDSTIVDLKILSNLALYHSRRIPAAVNYCLYSRTKDPAYLDAAIAAESSAIDAWQQIVDAAADVYADDLMFGARPRDLCGNWRDELKSLQTGLRALQLQQTNSTTQPAVRYVPLDQPTPRPQVLHLPIETAATGKPVTIFAQIIAPKGIKWVRLRYRAVNQYLDYQTLPMQPTGTADYYQATVPAEAINPKWDFMYFLQIMDNDGNGTQYPDQKTTTPYFVVRLQR